MPWKDDRGSPAIILRRFGRPEIFNTDQGSQFTSTDFTGVLKAHAIKISMEDVVRNPGTVSSVTDIGVPIVCRIGSVV